MNRFVQLALVILSLLPLSVMAANDKPFTIPELKDWQGGEGFFTPSTACRIVYRGKQPELRRVAQQLADDYALLTGRRLEVATGKPANGDIVLEIAADKKLGNEGYAIRIADGVRVKSPGAKGLYWATRTLLQLSEQHQGSMPKGSLRDWPDYPMRGFMLDCGRKFFPMSMLRDYVKILSYYKMNTFHIHLSDNGFKQFFGDDWNKTYAAFRMECDTYPGLTARDGYYTKAEFRDLYRLADSLGVTIIPEIDVPAHSLAFTHYRPSIASKDYGNDHLDLFNPETYHFLDSLFAEYLQGPDPVFAGEYVHIGTDEYSNKDKKVVEKFRYFTDRYIRYIEQFGKKAVVWGSQTHAKGDTPIKVDNVLMDLWYNGYADPHDMINRGYRVISIPDAWVYIVPKAGYYYDYLNTKNLYNKWTPANINGIEFPERHPNIDGGMFAVWNDHVGNGISDKDVHYRVMPALRTLATKTWTGTATSFDYDVFMRQGTALCEAPGINYAGYYPQGTLLQRDRVQPGDRIDLPQVGWHYRVSFDIDAVRENRGTVLFSHGDTRFYLADPVSGLVGFSRDGYLNHFGYQFYPGEKAHVAIEGDQLKTTLYVNGKAVSTLDVKKITYGKAGINYISTLVFPLDQAGDSFRSRISNLRVESLTDQ